MSEENEDIQKNDDALGDDTHSEEAPWQMQDLHDLISLQAVEEFTQVELQHILALFAGLSSLASFYQAYVRTFNDIHTMSQARGDSSCRTAPFSEELYYSFPTPIEELVLHVMAKVRELQSTGRFIEYDFERHSGILSIVQDPQFHEMPIHESTRQKLKNFEDAIRIRQDRYNARGEAYKNRSHIHLQSRANIIPPTQRSSSSADDAVTRAQVRVVQTAGQLLAQTPIRSTSPMLGNYTSMSSPGGMGNLSYEGGSLTQSSHQLLPQNTSINSSSSNGGSMAIWGKKPYMATFSVESLSAFVSAVITHLAAGQYCSLNQWIPYGTETRENMYYQFLSKQLIGEDDLEAILADAPRFVRIANEYLQKSRAVKGVLSDTEAVQTQLKFKFNDPTNEKQNTYLTTSWVKFQQAHRELIDVPSGTDQQGLVDAFIECNLTRVSKAQYYMFAYL